MCGRNNFLQNVFFFVDVVHSLILIESPCWDEESWTKNVQHWENWQMRVKFKSTSALNISLQRIHLSGKYWNQILPFNFNGTGPPWWKWKIETKFRSERQIRELLLAINVIYQFCKRATYIPAFINAGKHFKNSYFVKKKTF